MQCSQQKVYEWSVSLHNRRRQRHALLRWGAIVVNVDRLLFSRRVVPSPPPSRVSPSSLSSRIAPSSLSCTFLSSNLHGSFLSESFLPGQVAPSLVRFWVEPAYASRTFLTTAGVGLSLAQSTVVLASPGCAFKLVAFSHSGLILFIMEIARIRDDAPGKQNHEYFGKEDEWFCNVYYEMYIYTH